MYATPTFTTDLLNLVTYVYNCLKQLLTKLMAYIVLNITLIGFVSTVHTNAKAMPTNDTDYSCHIKAVELV